MVEHRESSEYSLSDREVGVRAGCPPAYPDSRMSASETTIGDSMADEDALRAMAVEFTRNEEREKKILATCLHDGIGQNLAFLRIGLEAMILSSRSRDETEELEKILNLASQTIGKFRDLVFDLGSALPRGRDLNTVLGMEAERLCGKHGILLLFHMSESAIFLGEEVEILVLRCVQELLRTIAVRVSGGIMKLSLRREVSRVIIELRVDGQYSDPQSLENEGHGRTVRLSDLPGVRERLACIRGSMHFRTEIDGGTTIILHVLNY